MQGLPRSVKWSSTAYADDELEEPTPLGHQPLRPPSSLSAAWSEAAEPSLPTFPAARSPSPQLTILQPAPDSHQDVLAEHLSPTLSQTSPENAAVGAVEPAAEEAEEEMDEEDDVQPTETLHDVLVLAEARRLMQQLQHIGFPVGFSLLVRLSALLLCNISGTQEGLAPTE